MGFCSILRTLLTENLWGAAPNPALPLFFRRKAGQKNLIFVFSSEFACWRLWHANDHSFAKNKIRLFRLLVRENCSGASPQNLIFVFCSEFACWRLQHENAHSFAKNIICYFRLLVRVNCCGASPQSGAKELDFLCFALSLRASVYGTQTHIVSRKI